jgi:hypothetical protein
MRPKLIEHGFSIVLVSAALLVLLFFATQARLATAAGKQTQIKDLMDLQFAEVSDPFHRALLQDVMNLYYPGQNDKNTAAIQELVRFKKKEFLEKSQKALIKEELSGKKIRQLLGMYFKFILVYILVMAVTYYGVQTLGVWQFIRRKQAAGEAERAGKRTPGQWTILAARKVGLTIAYFILFSPAYVIAYSIRTEFSTDSLFFMVLLGVASNGLLVMYANKFHAFLTAESRKGYVETGLVKNLRSSYSTRTADGIPLAYIFRPIKRFQGHVFGHIFQNAQYQYLATIKEQAGFLITGLIIIEMALNIHGHLSYEMLRQILYKNYDIVLVIILAIFYTVKMTEIFTDWVMFREARKYENK